jgi:hypothetical protein
MDTKQKLRDALELIECLATDLRNAAKGFGIGNLDTMATLAEDARALLQSIKSGKGEKSLAK